MKRLSNHSGKTLAALALALPALFLTSGVKPATADGSWTISMFFTPTPTINPCTPHSSAVFTSGGRNGSSSVSCTSYYANDPGEPTETADLSAPLHWTVLWLNTDGQTPTPDHGFFLKGTASIGGAAYPIPAASASSTGGNFTGSMPSGYPSPSSKTDTGFVDATGPDYDYDNTVSAHTKAGPDLSGDPNQEGTPGKSSAEATASLGISVSDAPKGTLG